MKIIQVQCVQCGETHKIVDKAEDWEIYQKGEILIQYVFPYLSSDQRELLISRVCGSCFDKMFQEEDYMSILEKCVGLYKESVRLRMEEN